MITALQINRNAKREVVMVLLISFFLLENIPRPDHVVDREACGLVC
jgi:hypothetical protein